MKYNEIYKICQPVMDWLKEHYPHECKIVIDTNSAELIQSGKLVVLDKEMRSAMAPSAKSIDEIMEDYRDKFDNEEDFENVKNAALSFKKFFGLHNKS